jgi:hypothetical protein
MSHTHPQLGVQSSAPELPPSSSQALAPQARALQLLLRPGPQQIGADGMVQSRCSIFYYQPFSTTELLNWRNHTAPYSEKTQAKVDLIVSIFQTRQSTWDDWQQILLTLLNREE